MKTPRLIYAAVGFALLLLPVRTSALSPKEVVEQFVKMDVSGDRLAPQGWRIADALFVKHSEPSELKIIIVIGRNYAVSTATGQENTTEFYFGYEEVARISTSSLRFTPTNPGVETRSFLKYLVVSIPRDRTQGSKGSVRDIGSGWKIEGAQPTAVHLTAAAAIRYVTEMRDKATDPAVRQNANEALAKLAPYR